MRSRQLTLRSRHAAHIGRTPESERRMYRFVDGRVAERWAVRDDLGMLRELKAI
jgi:hypothetical protein